MKVFAVFISLCIILAALVLAFPDLLINPGPLMSGHQKLKRDCLACHIPFGGVKSVQCLSCHRPESIGIKTVSGVPVRQAAGKVNFHKGLAPASCVECHTDHRGRDARRSLRAFRHDALPQTLANNCNACHSGQVPKDPLHLNVGGKCAQCHDSGSWKSVLFNHGMLDAKLSSSCATCHMADKPADLLHRQLTANCAECHDARRWKPARFDHGKFVASGKQCVSCHSAVRPADALHRAAGDGCGSCHDTKRWKPAGFDHGKFVASGKQCVSCHSADRPADDLHRATGAGCGSCHDTNRWKPARFDHDRFFRLDGVHRASCRSCHTDGANFKKYTCTSCHEHSPSKIAAEHREEGIRDFQNCVRCHRSGSGGEGHGEEHHGGGYDREDDD